MYFKSIVLLILLAVAFSCAPSGYLAISSSTPSSQANSKSKKTILISDRFFSDGSRLAVLLNQKRYAELEQVTSKLDPNSRKFISGIRAMMAGDHEKAYFDLVTLPQSGFDFEVQLLMADVLHAKQTPNLNYSTIYQVVVDSTRDGMVREMAMQRFRFLRYEMAAQ